MQKITIIVLPKYLHYFGGGYDRKLSTLNIFRYYILFLVFIYFLKYINTKNRKEKALLEGIYMFFILIACATSFAPLHRIAYFFKIFEFLFFIYIFDFKKVNKIKNI